MLINQVGPGKAGRVNDGSPGMHQYLCIPVGHNIKEEICLDLLMAYYGSSPCSVIHNYVSGMFGKKVWILSQAAVFLHSSC